MRKNEGKGLIKTILMIVIIVMIIALTIRISIKLVTKTQLKDLKTDMLLIQQKAKSYSEEVSKQTVNLDETKEEDSDKIVEVENTQLIGTKVSECSTEIQAKAQEAGVTDLEEYYCLNKEDLDKMGINNVKLKEGEYFLVKYNLEDTEIIYTSGFEYEDEVYYKLTELEELPETEGLITDK
ncbi:MAG: hypothetical protein HFJ49_02050 [Clostridia bacterium]|jgi:hypothetical protein|nr:hypothetical protein [Clostridia bacterium]